MNKTTIEVDTRTFVRFWLVILALGLIGLFVWKALTGLIIVGVAAFLALAIQPLAARIKHLTHKENSSFASVIAYVIIVVVIGVILAAVAPVVVDETVKFVGQLPSMFQNTLGGWDGINNFGQSIGIDNLQAEIMNAVQAFSNSFVSNISSLLVNGIGAISSIVTNVLLTLVLTLLFAIEGPNLIDKFWTIIGGKRKSSLVLAYRRLTERVGAVIGTYVGNQVIVAILDGVVVTIAVFLLSLIFGFSGSLSVPMGLIALVFYLIPMFGPVISTVIISFVLLLSSPIAGIVYLVFYIIYSQIENNVIAPKLQANSLGLPMALVLVSIILGMYMFGLIGAIIAIPIAGAIKVVLEELPNIRDAEKTLS